MKHLVLWLLLAFQASTAIGAESITPCPEERSALCKEAEFLAMKLNQAAAGIEDHFITVDVDRWIITYRERSNRPLVKSPEAITNWASKVQREWCSISRIADFVHAGGEFSHRLENEAGESLGPNLMVQCL